MFYQIVNDKFFLDCNKMSMYIFFRNVCGCFLRVYFALLHTANVMLITNTIQPLMSPKPHVYSLWCAENSPVVGSGF